MKLTGEEEALRAGELGAAAQWAIGHQIKVGEYLGAADFVPVSQAHVMADTESLGPAGVEWLERMARLPPEGRRLRVPTITDPRGTEEYNLALSDRRAQAVRDRLQRIGATPGAVRLVPKGEIDATGTEETGWAKDRRVDFGN